MVNYLKRSKAQSPFPTPPPLPAELVQKPAKKAVAAKAEITKMGQVRNSLFGLESTWLTELKRQRTIREIMDGVLGTKKKKDPFTKKYLPRTFPAPPQDPANTYPNLHAATMAWDQLANHEYNIEFCKLIANAAIHQEESPFAAGDFPVLANMAFVYSLNLRRAWSKIIKPPAAEDAIAESSSSSNNTRKGTVRLVFIITIYRLLTSTVSSGTFEWPSPGSTCSGRSLSCSKRSQQPA